MSDDVRQAAYTLTPSELANLRHLYAQPNLDRGLADGLLAPIIEAVEIRADLHSLAALASGERGVPVAWGVLDSHGDMPNVYVEREKIDAALARLNVIGRTGPYRVVPLYAAPAVNDAGRGE